MAETKVILAILILSITISLGSTYIGLKQVGSLGSSTGMATTGIANLNILQEASVDVTDDFINFGAGTVNDSFNNATLDSEGRNSNWNNTVNDSSMEITNDGNLLVNVTVRSNRNSTIGNSTFACQNEQLGVNCGVRLGTFNFSFWSNDTDLGKSSGIKMGESGSCTNFTPITNSTGGTIGIAAQNNPKEFVNDTEDYLICSGLKPQDTNDSFILELQAVLPEDASGIKSATLTFTAIAND